MIGGPDRPFTRAEILAKIGTISDPVYPQLSGIARAVLALDPGCLKQPWRELVAGFTAT